MKSAYLLAGALMIAACSAAGAQTLVGTPSDAIGFDDVVVDGQTYDVTFGGGPFNQAFPSGLTFTSEASGLDAAGSLLNAFVKFSVTGFSPGQPCDESYCAVGIPFDIVDAAGDQYSWVVQSDEAFPAWNIATFPNGWAGNTQPPYFWGVFKPATGAPEPAPLGLMVLGLAGVGFASRKRKI